MKKETGKKKKTKEIIVEDLMIPLSEYATVSIAATLYDAVIALEHAQKNFSQNDHTHRAILVLDEDGHVAGKISQHDVLRALEYKHNHMYENSHLSRFGLDEKYMRDVAEQNNIYLENLNDMCKLTQGYKVADFMYIPTKGEYTERFAPLTKAIHLLNVGHHSLLVMQDQRNKKVVGILRLVDVFAKTVATMKACRP